MSDERNERARYVHLFTTVGYIAAFSALAFLATTFVRIPLPVSGGYFNIGDTFVMAAGALFGPIAGFFVGLIGPTASDAIGYPVFVPATAIIKSLEGLIVGIIAYKQTGGSASRVLLSVVVGAVIIVCGYFAFEGYIYPILSHYSPFFNATNFGSAIGELVPNAIQALISAVLAFGLWQIFGSKRGK
jgi:uncharacterized membrane protein